MHYSLQEPVWQQSVGEYLRNLSILVDILRLSQPFGTYPVRTVLICMPYCLSASELPDPIRL